MPSKSVLRTVVWIATTLLVAGGPASAEPDDLQQAWLDRVTVSHRWDNVEGAPTYVRGFQPEYRRGAGLHFVRLEPGASTTLRVPEGESARVYSPQKALSGSDLDFTWSNGSGLYLKAPAMARKGSDSLIASAPSHGQTLLQITRPRHSRSPLEVALFVSRRLSGLVTTKYQNLLRPTNAGPTIRLVDEHAMSEYWSSNPQQPLRVAVEGPLRIELRTRLMMPRGNRSIESYRAYAELDDAPWQVLNFETTLETRRVIAVEGCTGPLGRVASAYLDIPEGRHLLQLRFRRPVYARLLSAQQPDDYFFDGNRPSDYRQISQSASRRQPETGFWAEAKQSPGDAEPAPVSGNALAYRNALRVAEDNGYQEGGLAAAMALQSWWPRFPGHSPNRAMVSRRLKLHTFYRPLTPRDGSGASVFAWFETTRLQQASQPAPVIPHAYTQTLLRNLPGGYFAPVPAAPKAPLRYSIPQRPSASYLRVAVERSRDALGASLFVQFDESEPFELRLQQPAYLSEDSYLASTPGTALALLEGQHQARGKTLAGPFAAGRRPAPLTSAGHLEIPLPAPVRTITVWQTTGQPNVWLALAYRSGKPFSRSESDILALLDAVGEAKTGETFSDTVRGLQHSLPARPFATLPTGEGSAGEDADYRADLKNQWQPLMRLLRNRYLQLSADVEPPQTSDRETTMLSKQRLDKLQTQAAGASRDGDWHRALERWGTIRRGSDGKIRDQARLEQVSALRQLGNAFLSDRLLREAFLFGHSATLRQEAYAQLLATREQAGDANGTLSLVATLAVMDPQPRHLRRLAQALLDVDQTRNALLVLLAQPAAERPSELSLRAAYLQGWWQVFEQSLSGLDKETERLRWRGYRAQHEGDYAAALDLWARMGTAGEALHARLVRGLAIRAELDSSDPGVRWQTLSAWQQWQAEGLTAGRYSGQPSAIRHSKGSQQIQSLQSNQVISAHRAEFAKPLVIPVYGPTRLRITVRPIHDSQTSEAGINDWVNVWRKSEKQVFPIIDNRPSPGLVLVGQADRKLGRGTSFEYRVPPGYHEIRLEPERRPVLVETKLLRPALPLTILPPLTPYTARAALQGQLGTRPPIPSQSADRPGLAEVLQRCQRTPMFELSAGERASIPESAQTAIELPSYAWFRRPQESIDDASTAPHIGSPGDGPVERSETNADTPLERLRHWLWVAEHQPEKRTQALAQAERAFADDPTLAGAEPLMRRLRNGTGWERVRAIQQSAGVRAIETSDWEPEHPALRVRKALMKPLRPGEQIVSGFDTLVLAVENTERTQFMLELQSESVGYQRAHDMDVLVAVDEQPEQQVQLSAATPEVTLLEELGRGQRVLRVRIAQPLSNQFLRVRVRESRDGTQRPVEEPSQRLYDVATTEEPLIAYVDGPAWLRVDEFREGGNRISYRQVEAGSQRLVLSPPGIREEALYRIYRRAPTVERPKPGFRPLAMSLETLEPPPLQPPDGPTQPQGPINNSLPLGGQEDGTWSAYTALVSRRALNDEPESGIDADRYFSTGLGYRYFSERQETYYESALRLRLRDSGEPTLAFRQWIDVRRGDLPFDLDLAGSLFIQNSEAAATLRGRVSRQWKWGEKTSNRPSATIFQRFLTLDDVSDYHGDQLDQDVFTAHKGDHKRGLNLSNLTAYRPRADTVLHARVTVNSNQELNPFDPDSVQLRLGTKQLFGEFTFGTGLSLTHYFADKDRDSGDNQSKFWLDLGYLGFWSPRDGAEAKFRVQYDGKSEDTSVWLAFTWNRSNGRYFRDFRPSDIDFIALRNRRALEKETAPVVLDGLESM